MSLGDGWTAFCSLVVTLHAFSRADLPKHICAHHVPWDSLIDPVFQSSAATKLGKRCCTREPKTDNSFEYDSRSGGAKTFWTWTFLAKPSTNCSRLITVSVTVYKHHVRKSTQLESAWIFELSLSTLYFIVCMLAARQKQLAESNSIAKLRDKGGRDFTLWSIAVVATTSLAAEHRRGDKNSD